MNLDSQAVCLVKKKANNGNGLQHSEISTNFLRNVIYFYRKMGSRKFGDWTETLKVPVVAPRVLN
jgi:hypothetical protein